MVRRYLDRVVAAVASIVAAPAVLVVAAVVFLYDRSAPVIMVDRVGRGGNPLSMPKLRSMRPNPGGSMITSGRDDRVTTPGRLIRKLKLDELPQLWSVVRGDMTLFGPRPEDPTFVDACDPDWQEILRMAPGMAGLTQLVVGDLEIELLNDREEVEQMYRTRILPVKIELDRWYVKHASPRTDALVAIGLIQRVLSGRRSQAVDNYVRSRVPSAAEALSQLQAVAA